MASYLRPRRGKKSTAIAQKIILKRGEIFFEVPNTGVGTGIGKMKMGDGTSTYDILPYFSNVCDTGIEFTETSEDYNATLLNTIVSGTKLSKIIANMKNLLVNLDNSRVRYLPSSKITDAGKIDTLDNNYAPRVFNVSGWDERFANNVPEINKQWMVFQTPYSDNYNYNISRNFQLWMSDSGDIYKRFYNGINWSKFIKIEDTTDTTFKIALESGFECSYGDECYLIAGKLAVIQNFTFSYNQDIPYSYTEKIGIAQVNPAKTHVPSLTGRIAIVTNGNYSDLAKAMIYGFINPDGSIYIQSNTTIPAGNKLSISASYYIG